MKTKDEFYSLLDQFTSESVINQPIKGDKKQFFGKWFVYSGSAWVLNEVCNNVINKKNSGSGRLYNAHPVTR